MTDHHTSRRLLFIKGRQTAERLKAAGLIALFFLAFGIVGRMDYEDAVAMEAVKQETLQMAAAHACDQ